MSWREVGLDHLRTEFVMVAREPEVSKSAVCREFGISRKTGYKWLQRYAEQGLAGLVDRSRRPRRSPLEVSGAVVLELVRLRGEHPHWGPKKLRALLVRTGYRVGELPALATVGRILRRAGLSETKGRGRPRRWEPTGPLETGKGPNDVWTVDFKGWWRTGDGQRCEPLGIRDLYSRYVLCLRPMERRRGEDVRRVFAETFERYGLPEAIRSDNGAPFASLHGPHGLTRLSAWWKTLGIRLDRIEPGHPEQNGGHERMHRDLAQEIEGRPAATQAEEARRLERWRIEYNIHRPHEALAMKTPGEVYRRSPRRLEAVQPYRYPTSYLLRRVDSSGYIVFTNRYFRISQALVKTEVGLERLAGTRWQVWFCDLPVKEIDVEREAPRWLAAPPRQEVSPMS